MLIENFVFFFDNDMFFYVNFLVKVVIVIFIVIWYFGVLEFLFCVYIIKFFFKWGMFMSF